MEIQKLAIDGLVVIHPRVFQDTRGFFFESFNADKFRSLGLRTEWAQDNHARSQKNTLRGLHFQLGPGQAKIARCVRGRVWDVAVDIRPSSPTLGRWFGLELSESNQKMFYISEGFAHGYCVLSDEAEVIYKCGTTYDPELESEIAWNDPKLAIEWPIATPLISERDKKAGSFDDYLKKVTQEGIRR